MPPVREQNQIHTCAQTHVNADRVSAHSYQAPEEPCSTGMTYPVDPCGEVQAVCLNTVIGMYDAIAEQGHHSNC